MGRSGDREKGELDESQKWDYVTLSDFHGSGALTCLSYAWLWILGVIAVAVYGADTFTAINLLAYDKWSGQIEPAIPLKYSKWIFAACIMFSWALCIFEWVRAIRVIRRGSVAESYMDSVAVTLQSMRPRGWKRFLVFAELTKSKKGVDYIALFVYFSFKGAIRIILAEGPRQVVNAITLYSFMQSDLIPTGSHAATEDRSSFEQFWVNVETLAEANREQAVVLFTMLFTLVIWVISALCLIIAVVLYLLFLWHYIPQSDGRLSTYCRRKIDRRLEKIVGQKVKQALEEQEKKQAQDEARAARKANRLPTRPPVNRKPTLPQVTAKTPDLGQESDFGLDAHDTRNPQQRPPPTRTNTAPLPHTQRQPTLPDMRGPDNRPVLPPSRNLTALASTLQRQPTLPDVNESLPLRTNTAPPTPLHRQPTLPDLDIALDRRPPMPYRSDTEASALSNATYASNAPLLGNANDMGYSDNSSHFPTQPPPAFDRSMSYASRHVQPTLDRQLSYADRPVPTRSMTADPHPSQGTTYAHREEPSQYGPDWTPEPANPAMDGFAHPHPYAMPSYQESADYVGPQQSAALPRQRPQQPSQRPFTPLTRMGSGLSFVSRQTPEPEVQSFEMTVQPRTTRTPQPYEQQPLAYMPEPFEQQPPSPPRQQQQQQQQRSASAATGGYVAFNPSFALAAAAPSFQPPERSFTSPPEAAKAVGAAPQRSATAPPDAAGSYDDFHVIEEYRVQPEHNYHEAPVRSATVAPDQQHGYHDTSVRSATFAPNQQYGMRHGW